MIAAVVLAAGEASRFGSCKQLVRIGERTLLEHVLRTLAQSRVDDVVVVLGAHREDIQKQVVFAREQIVLNRDWVQGMSTSIQAGLRALPNDVEAAVIMLGDQPFVSPSTIDALIDAYRRTNARIVIPTFRGERGNPVLADRSLFDAMMALRGDSGLRAVFAEYEADIVRLPVDDAGIVTDIDTQDDLQRSRC